MATSAKKPSSSLFNINICFSSSDSGRLLILSVSTLIYTNFVEYDVQPGDSLSNIAELFGTKTEKIKQANKLDNTSVIKAGVAL